MGYAADLCNQATQLFRQGQFRSAASLLEQGIVVARQEADSDNELLCYQKLTAALMNLDQSQQALELATTMLARARQLNEPHYELVATIRLCSALIDLDLKGRWPEIKTLLRDCLHQAEARNTSAWQLDCLRLLAGNAMTMQEYDDALSYAQQGLSIIRHDTYSADFYRYVFYRVLQRLHSQREDHADALRYGLLSFEYAQREGNPAWVVLARRYLAHLHYQQGNLQEAFNLFSENVAAALAYDCANDHQDATMWRAEIALQLEMGEQALEFAREALALARQRLHARDEAWALLANVRALHKLNRSDEAWYFANEAYHFAQTQQFEHRLKEAREWIETLTKKQSAPTATNKQGSWFDRLIGKR
ncbi:hypothetical protein [Herpetosiphon giganteus]|uniref:hypothetical protein n=1 Tax=Herpetosiphon giganteus TaxID=2029754 RepID=UPI00195D50E8|nr:hypothetical protein [Herpetosiphon giganteus]MBM7842197.1 tetratricopeptide (TPR) repeat protein [Herpetosiphon giganteus]